MNPRRILAGALVVVGAVLLFAAPETLAGAIVAALGIVIEVIGIALDRRAKDRE